MKNFLVLLFISIASLTFSQTIENRTAIEKIVINKIPMASTNGSAWDSFSAPDVFIIVFDSLGNEIAITKTIQDVNESDFPIEWKLDKPIILVNSNIQYKVCIYDEDITKNELIDETELYSFIPDNFEFQIVINTKKYNAISLICHKDY